jgi:hypothetical protein
MVRPVSAGRTILFVEQARTQMVRPVSAGRTICAFRDSTMERG